MRVRSFVVALIVAAGGSLVMALPVDAACTISATPVTFGGYNVFGVTPLDAAGQVTFRCVGPPTPLVRITLDKGGAPSFSPRLLHSGGQTLSYNLYLDAARTVTWGDGTGGTQFFLLANPQNGQSVAVPVYGRVPAGQDVSAGSYTNTVTVTIFF